MHARAAILRETGYTLSIEDVELEAPRAGEVRVRMVGSGICHTDLGFMSAPAGPMTRHPIVLGHEGAGIVEAVGPGVTNLSEGDPVVLTIDSCGHCPACDTGKPTYCDELFPRNFFGTRLDGTVPIKAADGSDLYGNFFGQSAFATHAISTARNSIKVPVEADRIGQLAPLGCGMQTGAGTIMNALKPAVGQSVAVFGVGGVGMAAIMAARIMGCSRIIAVDLLPERLELAMELGATHGVNAGDADPVKEIHGLTGRGADFTLECTGIGPVVMQAINAASLTGTCAVIGAPPPGTSIDLPIMALQGGRTIRGIIEGDAVPSTFIPLMAQLWADGEFPFDRLVKTYAFNDINTAIDDAHHGRTIKPVLTF